MDSIKFMDLLEHLTVSLSNIDEDTLDENISFNPLITLSRIKMNRLNQENTQNGLQHFLKTSLDMGYTNSLTLFTLGLDPIHLLDNYITKASQELANRKTKQTLLKQTGKFSPREVKSKHQFLVLERLDEETREEDTYEPDRNLIIPIRDVSTKFLDHLDVDILDIEMVSNGVLEVMLPPDLELINEIDNSDTFDDFMSSIFNATRPILTHYQAYVLSLDDTEIKSLVNLIEYMPDLVNNTPQPSIEVLIDLLVNSKDKSDHARFVMDETIDKLNIVFGKDKLNKVELTDLEATINITSSSYELISVISQSKQVIIDSKEQMGRVIQIPYSDSSDYAFTMDVPDMKDMINLYSDFGEW